MLVNKHVHSKHFQAGKLNYFCFCKASVSRFTKQPERFSAMPGHIPQTIACTKSPLRCVLFFRGLFGFIQMHTEMGDTLDLPLGEQRGMVLRVPAETVQ